MTEAEQIEQQAETIKSLWHRNEKLQKRCDAQQAIIDRQDQRIALLENPITRGDLEFELLTGKGQ